jgi:hypothetical protein
MTANTLYSLLVSLCAGSYIWIIYNYLTPKNIHFLGCIIKNVTTLPCPACGTTRGVMTFLQGNYAEAFLLNPLSYFAIIALLIVPIWCIFDFITSQKTLWVAYHKTEKLIQKTPIALLLIILILLNWFWNIQKNL